MKIKSLKKGFTTTIFWLIGLTLPTQLGKHFWPSFSYLSGMRIDYLSPTIYLVDFFLLAALFIIVPKRITKIKIPPVWQKIFLGIIFVLLINLFIAADKGLFAWRFFQYLKTIAMFFLFTKATAKQIKYFFNGLGLATILAVILAVSQIINQGSLQGLWYFFGERSFTINSPGVSTISIGGRKLLRAYAFFSHPNSLAGFFLPLVLAFYYLKKPLLAFLAVGLVILSFSKFAIALLAVILGLWLKTRSQKSACFLCRLTPLFFTLSLITFALMLKGDPSSLSSRLRSYQFAFNHLWQSPLGSGLGHYLRTGLNSSFQPVHNIFLLLTLELGILIWPAIIFATTKLINQCRNHNLFWGWLIIIFLAGSFDHYFLTLNQNMLLLGIILGVFFGIGPKRKTLNLFEEKA